MAQVRLIFRPRLSSTHPFSGKPLAYVYLFDEIPRRPERDIHMYCVSYVRVDQDRVGKIVDLASVTCLLQLVPVYGERMDRYLTFQNSMDVWDPYYINSFMDKETYQSIW